MKHFTIKATNETNIECSWHLEADTKEDAEVEFKKLMPRYVISKIKEKSDERNER